MPSFTSALMAKSLASSGQKKHEPVLYDGCPYAELLSPQGSRPLENWTLSSGAQYLVKSQLQKSSRPASNSDLKVYERDLKGFCFHCHGSTRFSYPAVSGSGSGSNRSATVLSSSLHHPILVMQVWIPFGEQFLVEIGCLDSTMTNSRRLVLSSAVKCRKNAAMHTQLPLDLLNSEDELDQGPLFDVWLNIVVDLKSIVQAAFKDDFVGVQSVSLGGPGSKLRKVFLCRDRPDITAGGDLFTKKGLDFPEVVQSKTVVIHLDNEIEKANRRFTAPQPSSTSPSKSSLSPSKTSPSRKPSDAPRFKVTRPMSNPEAFNDRVQLLKPKGSSEVVDEMDESLTRIMAAQKNTSSAPNTAKSPRRQMTIVPRPLKRNEQKAKISIVSERIKAPSPTIIDSKDNEESYFEPVREDSRRSTSVVPQFPDDEDDGMTFPGDKSKSPEPTHVTIANHIETSIIPGHSYSPEPPQITFEFKQNEDTHFEPSQNVEIVNDQEYNDIKKWIAGSDDLIQSTSKLLSDLRIEVEEAIAEENNKPSDMKLHSILEETGGASNSSLVGSYYNF